jgi:hypothetical protein
MAWSHLGVASQRYICQLVAPDNRARAVDGVIFSLVAPVNHAHPRLSRDQLQQANEQPNPCAHQHERDGTREGALFAFGTERGTKRSPQGKRQQVKQRAA